MNNRRLHPALLSLPLEGGRGALPLHPHSWQKVLPDGVTHTTIVPGSSVPQELQPAHHESAFFGASYPVWFQGYFE